MPAIAGQAPPRYEPSFKLQVIEEANAGATSFQKLADMRNVSVATIHNWVNNEREIRKLYAKDQRQRLTNGHATNGHSKSNGKVPPAVKVEVLESATPEKKRKGLRVLGLEAIIREQVAIEVARQLPAIIKQELAGALTKAFADKVTGGPER